MYSPLLLLSLSVGLPTLVSAAAERNGLNSTVAAFVKKLRSSAGGESYTMNSACLPNYCINPVIPGLMFMEKNQLEENKKMHWTCANIGNTKSLFKLAGFCSRIIAAYPFMMPTPAKGNPLSEGDAIQLQSRKALETFVGHISGMGHDFWDHTTPWDSEDECIKSVWQMSCYTHFPRCNELNPGHYLAPCASECQGYLKKCAVECCDEGVQCVFSHTKKLDDGSTVSEHGYPDHKGPSPLCTGGAHQPFSAVAALLLAVFAVLRQ